MDELLRVERDGASNSSSSQANEVKELRRDRERSKRKGLSPDRSTGRRRGMDGGRGQARGGRFFMMVGGSRPGV